MSVSCNLIDAPKGALIRAAASTQPFDCALSAVDAELILIVNDLSDPKQVVRSFIAAMNLWEQKAHKLGESARDSEDPASYWPEVNASREEIYRTFCTSKERLHGRNGSYSNPPEYDPETERIMDLVQVSPRKVFVITKQESGFCNRCQYALVRIAGQWRIDNRRFVFDDGTSISNTL